MGVPEFSYRNIFSEKICMDCLTGYLEAQGVTLQCPEDLFYFVPTIWQERIGNNPKSVGYEMAKQLVPQEIIERREALRKSDLLVTFDYDNPSTGTDFWRNSTEGEMEIYDSLLTAMFSDPQSFETRTMVEFVRERLEKSGLIKNGSFYRMGPGVVAAENIRQAHIEKFMMYQRQYFGG
jgi:hypothetical protein